MKQYNFNGVLLRDYGVYIRTLLTSNTEINGVGSGVVGIVGLSERGSSDEPKVISSFSELVATYGDGPLTRHGLAAFAGGASQLVVQRIGNPQSASLSAHAVGASTAKSYTIQAREKGTYGNNVTFGVREGLTGDNITSAVTPSEVIAKVLSENNDFYEVLIRYTDRTGVDVRERYVFPKYIPSVEVTLFDGTVGKRFFAQNTNFFFMLRDRETGELRYVPEVWTFGAVTAADFLGKIDENKGSNEDLITLPVKDGTSRNFFPMAVIAHIINNGGLGYAPSEFVEITDLDVSIEDLAPTLTGSVTNSIEVDPDFSLSTREELIVHEPVNLAGGFNGDDGTSYYAKSFEFDGLPEVQVNYEPTLGGSNSNATVTEAATQARNEWIRGLQLMENFEEVDFIQPAYLFHPKAGTTAKGTTWAQRIGFFKSIVPLFVTHVTTTSGTQPRKFRTTILGTPWYKSYENIRKSDMDFLNSPDIKEISGMINNDRVQLWMGGFKSRALSTKLEAYGAEMVASLIVGIQSSKEVPDGVTFQQLSGIVTDGLEFYWGSQASSELYARSVNTILRRKSITGALQYIASSNVTSWTGNASRGITLFSVRRTVDYMNKFLFKNLEENFIGLRSAGGVTAEQIQAYSEALLQRLVNDKILVAFANVTAKQIEGSPNAYTVTYDFMPFNEIDFIFVTNTLRWDL